MENITLTSGEQNALRSFFSDTGLHIASWESSPRSDVQTMLNLVERCFPLPLGIGDIVTSVGIEMQPWHRRMLIVCIATDGDDDTVYWCRDKDGDMAQWAEGSIRRLPIEEDIGGSPS